MEMKHLLMKNLINSSVLVTGGTGAVGTNLVNKLLDFGAKVIVLDNFSQSKKSNLNFSKNLTVIKGNITNEKILEKIFLKKIDYALIHESLNKIENDNYRKLDEAVNNYLLLLKKTSLENNQKKLNRVIIK